MMENREVLSYVNNVTLIDPGTDCVICVSFRTYDILLRYNSLIISFSL